MTDKLYRPSNGIEGHIFMEKFCYQCEHDDAYNRRGQGEKQCPIIPLTMVHATEDAEYPPEWTYDANGNPTCTKFQSIIL